MRDPEVRRADQERLALDREPDSEPVLLELLDLHADDPEGFAHWAWQVALACTDAQGRVHHANYINYFERGLKLLRDGGLLLFDNTLWSGRVADPGDQDADTRAIRELNDRLLEDAQVSLSLVPIGDGLSLARKR